MATESRFQSVYRRRVDAAVRRARAAWLARAVAILGLGVVAAAVIARLQGADAVGAVAWAWAVALAVAVLGAMVVPREGAATRRQVARSIDDEQEAEGAVLSAAWVLEGRVESRLAGLVVRDADRICEPVAHKGSAPVPTAWFTLALGLVCLSLLLPVAPSPFSGPGWFGGARGGPQAATRGPVSGQGAGVSEPGDGEKAPPTDLGDVARFEIRTDHAVYLVGEEIRLTGLLRPLAHVGADVPLEVVVGLADGLPSKDLGFGIGVRPVPADWGWVLREETRETIEGRLLLKEHLERLGMNKVGLITIEAWLRPKERRPDVVGGIRSNRLTIQIAPNRKRQQVRKPEPVEKKRRPKKKKDQNKDKKDRGRRGGSPPELGEKDRLKEARRKAKAVKPLLADGPTVDKEVEVFERERGGEDIPSPKPPPTFDSPTRTFLKMEEQAVKRLRLTPRDERILKEYFDAVRRRG